MRFPCPLCGSMKTKAYKRCAIRKVTKKRPKAWRRRRYFCPDCGEVFATREEAVPVPVQQPLPL